MAKKGNIKNLRVPTSEEAREIGRKGGIKSAEVRKQRKDLKERLEILLEAAQDIVTDENGNPVSGADGMAITAFKGALNGDWKAWELVRDTAGQKPTEKLETTVEKSEKLADVLEQLKEDE